MLADVLNGVKSWPDGPEVQLPLCPESGLNSDIACGLKSAISSLPFSENRRIADDKNVNGSRTWLAVCRAKVVTLCVPKT
jgi:hypothetical protein